MFRVNVVNLAFCIMLRNQFLILVLVFEFTQVNAFAVNDTNTTESPKHRKMVIDTEPGLDDAVAIVTALGRSDVEILGLTCPNGNTGPDQAAKNALRVLSAAGRLDIPIFKGTPLPLLGKAHYSGPAVHFGNDGLGDADFNEETLNMSLIRPEHAAIALVDFVNKNPGEVIIVALGPLTNIALALKLDSTFAEKTKELHIMGGSPTALGNKGPVSEFNFAWDPEAAAMVLDGMHCPMFITTWDVCVKNLLNLEQKNELLNGTTNIATFLRKVHTSGRKNSLSDKPYSLCDSISIAYALNRSVSTETYAAFTTVELCGEHSRGQMIADRADIYHFKPNARIVQEINLDEVISMIRTGILSH